MFFGCQPCCGGCPVNYAPFLDAESVSASIVYTYEDRFLYSIDAVPETDVGLNISLNDTYTLSRTSLSDGVAQWSSGQFTASGRTLELTCTINTQSTDFASLEFKLIRGAHPSPSTPIRTGVGWIGMLERPCVAEALGLWRYGPSLHPYQYIEGSTFRYAYNRDVLGGGGISNIKIVGGVLFGGTSTLEIEQPLVNACQDFDPLIVPGTPMTAADLGVLYDTPTAPTATGVEEEGSSSYISEGQLFSFYSLLREQLTVTSLVANFDGFSQNMLMNVPRSLWSENNFGVRMRATAANGSVQIYQFDKTEFPSLVTPCARRRLDPYYDPDFICDYFPNSEEC